VEKELDLVQQDSVAVKRVIVVLLLNFVLLILDVKIITESVLKVNVVQSGVLVH